uniref:Uncharacterized protein n=1 Tax=Tanacetum cinerariifolium TaxID=118510 RepID=A0A6L2LLP6_TANCI|nr:hypothetical protein [Tanacetum cinerariifolium]
MDVWILSFLGAYFIALREDTQHLSMGDFGHSSVNKSSSPIDNSKQRDTQPTTNIQSTTEPTIPTTANAEENNDNQAEDEFTNPLCTSVREITGWVVISDAVVESVTPSWDAL